MQQGFIGAWGESWSEDPATILENSPTRIQARYNGGTTDGYLRMKFTLVP